MDEGPNEHRHGRGRPVRRAMYDVWMGTDGGWVKIWVGGGGGSQVFRSSMQYE